MKNRKRNYAWNRVEPFSNIYEMLANAAAESGDRTAFEYINKDGNTVEVTYEAFRRSTLQIGTAMQALGIDDKHVAMVSENRYEFIQVYLTMLQSRGVFVPLDKELPLTDKINVLKDSDSEVAFVSGKFASDLMAVRHQMPAIRLWILLDEDSLPDETSAKEENDIMTFSELLEMGEELCADEEKITFGTDSEPDQVRVLVYTSGTTGMAKGVMLTEHNICACVYHGLQVVELGARSLSVLPYNHTYEAGAILASLHSHSTICINDNLRHVLKNLNRFHPDYIYLVPAFAELFYKRIWTNAKRNGKEEALKKALTTSRRLRRVGVDVRMTLFASIHAAFGGRLTRIVCGGAPLRPEIGEFFDDIGIQLLNGYGITECSPLVSANRVRFNDPHTVGTVLPGLELRFDEVGEDGNGEICVRGANVMKGYYKQPELTSEVLEKDGWFHTGDYGRLNKQGQLMITGRKKNLIILSNGKNIYPEEIESYLGSIPYVSEVVVYAQKDEHGMDNALCAAVYCAPELLKEQGITDLAERLKADVTKACQVLPDYKRVSRVVVRDTEFVKTTTKKIKRNCI